MSETFLDQIEKSLIDSLTHNENAEVPPTALLWPDRDGQFRPAAESLRDRLPLLTLGEFDRHELQGPAYWLRCAIAGTIDLELPDGIPVVYLPGFGRDDLRAIEDCPREVAPIAELQYRGEWFSHPNGKDWTVRGFLSNSQRGLGLDVALDAETGDALLGAVGKLLSLPMRRIASQHIDADFLQRLLNPDPTARILEWLDDPRGFRSRIEAAEWDAFVGLCRNEYDFDPESDGEVIGGRMLGERQGAWMEVWRRFEQNPERFSGIEDRLRKGKPYDLFTGSEGSWPQDNEEAESNLRADLLALADSPPGEVRSSLERLWNEHRARRNWVWAKLDRAPLAFALEHLQRLAQLTAPGPAANEVEELVEHYAEEGWKADDAFLSALEAADEQDDRSAVAGAAEAVYRPWIDAHARAFQAAIGPMVNSGNYTPLGEASPKEGAVTVFVDGLRLDLGHRLAERLGSMKVTLSTALAPLPTVTQTAKAALTPIPPNSLTSGEGFSPARTDSGAKANITVLRSLMSERGVAVLQGADLGDPQGSAWTETGDVDKRGHDFGVAAVDEIDRELDQIAKRIKLLLDAGWQRVRVVTDHGWVLLPSGLEKVELPAATVEVKKGRCARLKTGAEVSVPTVPWHWDDTVRIALAPGVGCFEANQTYEHGGVSLQECIVPQMTVEMGVTKSPTGGASITKVKWLGLLCRVRLENVPPSAKVDIRASPADSNTSVAGTVKETTGSGRESLHVLDEELEGEEAYVVVLDEDGGILAQRSVTIGVNR